MFSTTRWTKDFGGGVARGYIIKLYACSGHNWLYTSALPTCSTVYRSLLRNAKNAQESTCGMNIVCTAVVASRSILVLSRLVAKMLSMFIASYICVCTCVCTCVYACITSAIQQLIPCDCTELCGPLTATNWFFLHSDHRV